jgi:hypothetical protein
MIRTVFALLALATLTKNDVSGRTRHACTSIFRAFADEVSESRYQRLAPMVSVCSSRNALCWELGRIFFAISCEHQTRRKGCHGARLRDFTAPFHQAASQMTQIVARIRSNRIADCFRRQSAGCL